MCYSYTNNVFDMLLLPFQLFSRDPKFALEIVENGLEFQASILIHVRSFLLQRVYSFDIIMDFPCKSVEGISVHSKHLSDEPISHVPAGTKKRMPTEKGSNGDFSQTMHTIWRFEFKQGE